MLILRAEYVLGGNYFEALCLAERGIVDRSHGTATVRCQCIEVLLNGLLLGAELEKVSSQDHSFEGVPCLDHVVLCQRGLAFFRRLWARC